MLTPAHAHTPAAKLRSLRSCSRRWYSRSPSETPSRPNCCCRGNNTPPQVVPWRCFAEILARCRRGVELHPEYALGDKSRDRECRRTCNSFHRASFWPREFVSALSPYDAPCLTLPFYQARTKLSTA